MCAVGKQDGRHAAVTVIEGHYFFCGGPVLIYVDVGEIDAFFL